MSHLALRFPLFKSSKLAASLFSRPAPPKSQWTRCPSQYHTRAKLPYDLDKGLGSFLPPEALHTVAVEYQEGLLAQLNEEVKGKGLSVHFLCSSLTGIQGTALENLSMVDTINHASADRTDVLTFNYASLALNNHFFLQQLVLVSVPPYLSH